MSGCPLQGPRRRKSWQRRGAFDSSNRGCLACACDGQTNREARKQSGCQDRPPTACHASGGAYGSAHLVWPGELRFLRSRGGLDRRGIRASQPGLDHAGPIASCARLCRSPAGGHSRPLESSRQTIGRIAQPVQSTCLTRRGSQVRILLRPPLNHSNNNIHCGRPDAANAVCEQLCEQRLMQRPRSLGLRGSSIVLGLHARLRRIEERYRSHHQDIGTGLISFKSAVLKHPRKRRCGDDARVTGRCRASLPGHGLGVRHTLPQVGEYEDRSRFREPSSYFGVARPGAPHHRLIQRRTHLPTSCWPPSTS
jgi:hypothetical protein